MARPLFIALFAVVVASATREACAAENVDYLKQVKPLLAGRCYACHGALKQEGGLRLDTAAALRTGGDSGPAIDLNDAAKSLVVERLTARNIDERMPPEGEGSPWKADEVALLRDWIAAGAAGPADEKPEADPREHWAFRAPVRPAVPPVKNQAWVRNPIDAFLLAELEERGIAPQPEAEPGVLLRRLYIDLTGLPPTLREVEEFSRLFAPSARLQVSQSSDRDLETRRLGDLERAYIATVDKLLASPQYGERWGRHWMDVWRYSDWWGLNADVRNSQKHIWHWRDWIVESLNDDVGYDEMVRQMLAADELYPDDLEKLRATGFLVRSYFKFNRNSWLEQVVEHTSKSMLGLTMNCCRCHDHKYDPLAQRDFYAFRAFFEPYQVRTDQLPGEADLEKDGLPRVFDCHLDAPTYRYVRGDETKPLKDEPIAPGLPTLVAPNDAEIVPVSLSATAHQPGLRRWTLDDQRKLVEKKIATAREALTAAKQKLAEANEDATADAAFDVESSATALTAVKHELSTINSRASADRAKLEESADVAKRAAVQAANDERKLNVLRAKSAVFAAEQEVRRLKKVKPPANLVHPLNKGEVKAVEDQNAKKVADAEKKLGVAQVQLKKAEEAAKATDEKYTPLSGSLKAFESSTESESDRRKPYPAMSTGRRTALAALLVDRTNPLTARVAVNHIWLRHMGKPLVPTVFDFGRKGTPPTHPELLDWLACEFREGREKTSDAHPSPLSPHPWSMKALHRLIVTSSAYRMSSASAGNEAGAEHDVDNVYYWRMNPVRTEAQVVRDALLHLAGELDLKRGGPSVDPAADPFSKRRSLYFVHSHNEHHRFLSMFDDADVLDCYRREQSIVPQQALALANAKQSLEAAEKIAARLNTLPEAKSDDGFIRAAYRTVLAYAPTPEEEAVCSEALTEWRKLPQAVKGVDVAARARVNLVHALLNHNDFVTVK